MSTNATLAYTIDHWLSIAELDHSTRHGYEGYIRRNIIPALGDVSTSKIKPRVLERAEDQYRSAIKPALEAGETVTRVAQSAGTNRQRLRRLLNPKSGVN